MRTPERYFWRIVSLPLVVAGAAVACFFLALDHLNLISAFLDIVDWFEEKFSEAWRRQRRIP